MSTSSPEGSPFRHVSLGSTWGVLAPVQECIFCLHVLRRWRFGFIPDPQQSVPDWPSFAYRLSAQVTRQIGLRDDAETRITSCHEPFEATRLTMSMEPMYCCRRGTFVSWLEGFAGGTHNSADLARGHRTGLERAAQLAASNAGEHMDARRPVRPPMVSGSRFHSGLRQHTETGNTTFPVRTRQP
jgi:hypothetical protein